MNRDTLDVVRGAKGTCVAPRTRTATLCNSRRWSRPRSSGRLDRHGLRVRPRTRARGSVAADFSGADLGRFKVSRLMSTINRLGDRVEVKVRVRRANTTRLAASAATLAV